MTLRDGQGFIDLNDLTMSIQIDGELHRMRLVGGQEVALSVGRGPEVIYPIPVVAPRRQDQLFVWLARVLRGIPQCYVKARCQEASASGGRA